MSPYNLKAQSDLQTYLPMSGLGFLIGPCFPVLAQDIRRGCVALLAVAELEGR